MSAKRTTVRLEESLLEQAKAEAARRNKTLTAMLEVGLRLALVNPSTPVRRKKATLPVSRRGGGTMPESISATARIFSTSSRDAAGPFSGAIGGLSAASCRPQALSGVVRIAPDPKAFQRPDKIGGVMRWLVRRIAAW